MTRYVIYTYIVAASIVVEMYIQKQQSSMLIQARRIRKRQVTN